MLMGCPEPLAAFPLCSRLNGVLDGNGCDLGELDEDGFIVSRKFTILLVQQHEHTQRPTLRTGYRDREQARHRRGGCITQLRIGAEVRPVQSQRSTELYHVGVYDGAALGQSRRRMVAELV